MKIILAILVVSCLAMAEEKLTKEESIQNTLASVAGSTIRHQKGNISECTTMYKGTQLTECEKGFKKTDLMLTSPSNHSK
ncbi:MAG: hypothetical protein WC667_04875 [Sulfurimonas sp.]|jgi:hypothetical protein